MWTIAGLVALLFVPPASAAGPSVAFYYTSNPPSDILAQYDWVVLNADNITAEELERIKASGASVFAYLSVGEADRSKEWSDEVDPSVFIGSNEAWNSDIPDLASAAWIELVTNRAEKIKNRGFDGLFLDTLDSYTALPLEPEQIAAQREALAELVERIHAVFPGGKLIFNRGFEILDKAGKHAAAVAAESLLYGWDQVNRVYREVPEEDFKWLKARLDEVREAYGIPAIVIDYLPPSRRELAREAAKRVMSYGFIPWIATPGLDYAGVGAIEPRPRRVLVLYNGREAQSLASSSAHRLLAMPLESMGYVVEYLDVEDSLPEYELKGRYAGVVSWFHSPGLPDAARYHDWFRRQVESGVKVAALGALGFEPDYDLLKSLGVTPVNSKPVKPVTVAHNGGMAGFEAPIIPRTRELAGYRVSGERTASHFSTRDAEGRVFDVVFTGPWGGAALNPYVLMPTLERASRWIIDPFRFLSLALPPPPLAPDVTTENGRRLLFTHIDGDGAVTASEAPGGPLAIEVIRDRILSRYDYPATVSVIEGETAPYGLYPAASGRAEAAARDIFAMPHVEIASHSYSHPFIWPGSGGGEREEDKTYNLYIPGYSLDIEREIKGSVGYINSRLAPPGKKVRVFLWTGAALPGERAVALADELGLANINGGSTTITRNRDTFTRVSAIGRPVGERFQTYAPIMNENVYTNLWTGPFYGFEKVIETLELTGSPRRLKPIDIYYHFYSGAKTASLKALVKVYEWVEKQETFPVWASEYVEKVKGFLTTGVAETPDGGWRITGIGSLRTIRVDKNAGWPDFARSTGIAGFRDIPQGRYVHLTGKSPAYLYLVDKKPNGVPYLHSSNAGIAEWEKRGNVVDFRLRGHSPVKMTIAGASGGCVVSWRGGELASSGADGIQSFSFPVSDTGEARLECR